MVGFYPTGDGVWHGYLLAAGVFSHIDVPGASETLPAAINNALQILGDFRDDTFPGDPLTK